MPSENYTPKRNCLNCDEILSVEQNYCSNCGQHSKAYMLSVTKLIYDFFGTIFNLDSKIWVTLRDLFLPSRLTKAYVAGKRKSYINPIRLFIVLLLLFLTILTNEFNKSKENFLGNSSVHLKANRIDMLRQYDSLTMLLQLEPSGHIDSLRNSLFSNVVDSSDQVYNLQSIGILKKDSIKLSTHDIINLNKEEIFEKYDITAKLDKLIISKVIYILKDPRSSIRVLIGNILWMIIITILLTSLILKLFYIRGGHYLVEHIIILINHHSVLFAIFGITYFLSSFIDASNINKVINYSIFLTGLYILADLKLYFKQSWIKTIIKSIMISIGYIMIFCGSVLLVLVVSFLIL